MFRKALRSLVVSKPLLYWDSFSRMSVRQRIYWLRNKVIRHLIFRYFGKRHSAPENGNTDLRENRFWSQLPAKTSALLYFSSFHNLKRIQAKDGNETANVYWNMLLRDFISVGDGDGDFTVFGKRWLIDDESEESQNYQRFHLFPRYLGTVSNGGAYMPRLLSIWLGLERQLPVRAFDPLNCAIRLINWLTLISRYPDEIESDKSTYRKLKTSIMSQVRHLQNSIEFELGGNHVLFELYSLWLIHSLMPRAINPAEKLFPKEIAGQFDKGGFHREHSMHYHVQSTLAGLLWLHGMRSLGKPVDRRIEILLRDAGDHIISAVLPDDSVPQMGDKCYSILNHSILEDVRAVKELSIFLFGDRTIGANKAACRSLGSSYYIYQNDFLKIIIDIGNIGQPENPGHGHSDLLSFVLYSGNSLILGDPGTSSYCRGPDDHACKRAINHNTLSLDGHDQAYLWSNFRWAYLPEGVSHSVINRDGHFILTAQYFGFRQIGGFVHRRVFKIRDNKIVILDKVWGKGSHDLYISFVLHPRWGATICGNEIILNSPFGGRSPRITVGRSCDIRIRPIWIYPEYNTPVRSGRIALLFQNRSLPFECESTISL